MYHDYLRCRGPVLGPFIKHAKPPVVAGAPSMISGATPALRLAATWGSQRAGPQDRRTAGQSLA